MDEFIRLAHGSGGDASKSLIEFLVGKYLKNPIVESLEDSAVLEIDASRIAFTTDSYVVHPIFFPGGDIGSLAVNGTVNDLAMVGAFPLALTLSFIIEEGFSFEDLNRLMESISRTARVAGVEIVGGDTKVVEKGSVDRIFINTAGVGMVPEGMSISSGGARPGDVVILSGTIGDHGIAVLSQRQGLRFETTIESDTAPLNKLVEAMLEVTHDIHAMRDPTRGGLATTLNEIASRSQVGIAIDEDKVPIRSEVLRACEMFGLDPFYVANEGKLVAFVPESVAPELLESMRKVDTGKHAAIIGRVTAQNEGIVLLNTRVGGERILGSLSGELLPRIC